MRQRNTSVWPAMLPEVRDQDDRVWPTCEVAPGAVIDWPHRLTGFEQLDPPAADLPPAPAAKTAAKKTTTTSTTAAAGAPADGKE